MTAILTSYAEAKRDQYLELKENAQANFKTSSEALSAVTGDYESVVLDAAELDKEISSLRKLLSSANNTPADIAEINADLRDFLIEKSHITGAITDTQEDLNSAKLSADQYNDDIVAMNKRLLIAEAELGTAESMEILHSQWMDNDLENDITVARDNAIALIAETYVADPEDEINPAELLSDAGDRIETDIPEVLLERARARATLVSNRMDASLSTKNTLLSQSLNQVSSSTGHSGLVSQRWSELEIAHNNVKAYALTMVRQYDTALDILQNIVGSSELSDADGDAISAAALAVDDEAVTTEVTLHNARAAVDAKRIELETAIINAVIADVNADPEDNADVQTKEADLILLEADLTAAETAHTSEFSTAMDIWEAAVPSYIWNNLQQYDRAIALLTLVSTTVANPLTTALTDAETALVSAMQDEDDDQRLSHYLITVADVLNKEYNYLLSANKSMTLSALRGDY